MTMFTSVKVTLSVTLLPLMLTTANSAIIQKNVAPTTENIAQYTHNGVTYLSTDRIITSIYSTSIAYGLRSYDLLYPLKSTSIEKAIFEHEERVRELAPKLLIDDFPFQAGYVLCAAINPTNTLSGISTANLLDKYEIENTDYMTSVKGNNVWGVYSWGDQRGCHSTGHNALVSGYFQFAIYYTCPASFFMKSRLGITDSRAPYCLTYK